MTSSTPADIAPETPAAIQGDDTPESVVAKLRDGCVLSGHEDRSYELVDEVATDKLLREAADLIEALATEIVRLSEELRIKEMGRQGLLKDYLDTNARLVALQAKADRQGDEATDRHPADQSALAAMTAERDAALAWAAAMREALEGLANVIERDCGLSPCASSMAPAEHYLGLARNALSTEAAPPTAQFIKHSPKS